MTNIACDSTNTSIESGQGLVEFSVILFTLLALFLGAFEVFNLYRQRTEIETVTRRAVRQAAESYVDEVNAQSNIEDYIYAQFEDMGYARANLETDLSIEIYGYSYISATQTIEVSTPVVNHCVYGEYIGIRIGRPLATTVIPLDLLYRVSNANPVYSAEEVNRCWRGS